MTETPGFARSPQSLMPFGISLPDEEHDGRRVGGAVVGQTGLPVGRQRPCLLGDLVDVVGQRQGDHVGLQAVDHRAGLLARAAVRLPNGHVLSGLALPVGGELGVEVLVELPRRIVRHVEQRHRLGRLPERGRHQRAGEEERIRERSKRLHECVSFELIVPGCQNEVLESRDYAVLRLSVAGGSAGGERGTLVVDARP